jgi:hypothetical protein
MYHRLDSVECELQSYFQDKEEDFKDLQDHSHSEDDGYIGLLCCDMRPL